MTTAAWPRAAASTGMALAMAACGPSSPPETVIAIGAPAQTVPAVDVAHPCPEGTHADPYRGCVEDTPKEQKKLEVARDDTPSPGEPYRAGEAAPPSALVAGNDSHQTALEDLRDPARPRAARARALVVVECQQLEALLGATPKTSSDRPKLLRRLGQDYRELAAAAAREKLESVVTGARQAAIRFFALLQMDHPRHCLSIHSQDPSKSTGCGDEIAYLMGYEYERLGQLDMSRKAYFTLIQNWPQSKYIPYGYLAFGEIFFSEAQSDPTKWMLAEQAYKEVLKFPFPENQVFAIALLRLGEAALKQGDQRKARAMFTKLRQLASQNGHLNAATVPASLIPSGP